MNHLLQIDDVNVATYNHCPQSCGFQFQSFTTNDLTLKPHRIDIWQYPLTTITPIAASLLNDSEQERADRYHFARHKRRFTIARATLRLIIANYLATHPKNIIFSENAYGKPEIYNNTEHLQFNLSHSEDLALLAIGKDFPVGIDLEFFAARPYVGIGNQMFSNKENQALISTKALLQPLSFFHIWAQKEAFIKACGLGLSYPTQEFDVPHLPPTHQEIFDSLHSQNVRMISFMPQVACCAALCHHKDITEIRYITLNDILTANEFSVF